MGVKYLLPCSCGKSLVVEARQSGLPVTCGCGQQQDVPTHRGLQQLARADEPGGPAPAATAAAGWGRRQGMLFLSVVFLMAAGALAWFAHRQIPPDPVAGAIEIADAQQLLFIWEVLRGGVDVSKSEQGMQMLKIGSNVRFWKTVAAAIAVAGLAVGASAVFIKGQPGKRV